MRITELFINIASCLVPYALGRLICLLLKSRNFNIRREAALFLFFCSLVIILSVTGITRASGFNMFIRWEVVNLTPFKNITRMSTGSSHGFLNIVGNVVLFVPVGFFVPLLWRQRKSLFKTVLIGAVLSLTIEFAQLFLLRNPDIDDLMLNTLGALTGYHVFIVFKKVFRKTAARVTAESGGFLAPLAYALFAALCLVFIL